MNAAIKETKTEARLWVLEELMKPHPLRFFSSTTHDLRATINADGIDPRIRRWLIRSKYATQQRDCEGRDILSITQAGRDLAAAWHVPGSERT